MRTEYPNAQIVSCSTSGEIMDENVYDNSVSVTAIQFEKSTIRCAKKNVFKDTNSYDTGKALMQELAADNLISIFIISEGSLSSGSELVSGFNENNPLNNQFIN